MPRVKPGSALTLLIGHVQGLEICMQKLRDTPLTDEGKRQVAIAEEMHLKRLREILEKLK